MTLYSDLFGEPTVAAQLSDDAQVRALLDVEAALAEAEARVGIVPAQCVGPIREAARSVARYDRARLAREAAAAGNLAIPLVRQLTEQVERIDVEAARHVHVGATSQDVLDTALVLRLRAALPAIRDHLGRAAAAAARHARQHRLTPIAGRTWLQQGTPTMFGLKAAGWLDALRRGRARLAEAGREACVLQFGGSTGSLAALGDAGPAVARALGDLLDLPVPDLPWHAQRDRLAALACALGLVTGTLGKIARDLALLAQTEVGEAFEGRAPGRGGSSSMPHKRNPVAASVALAAAARAPGLVAAMLGAMAQEHERGLGGWQAEWAVLPELVLITAGAARTTADALDGLVVDAARMAENVALTQGLIFAELVSAALAAQVGKAAAHALVEAACERAVREARPLQAVLGGDPAVTRALSPEAIARCFDAGAHPGASGVFIERALQAWARDEAEQAERSGDA